MARFTTAGGSGSGAPGPQGPQGPEGDSAYDVAVSNGKLLEEIPLRFVWNF